MARSRDGLQTPLVDHVPDISEEKEDYVVRETKSTYEEITVLLRFALPLGISHASAQLYDLTDQIILGRYGTDFLAAAGSAFIWTSLIDAVLLATVEQLFTLCAQAWGAGYNPLVGEWLQLWLVPSMLLAAPAIMVRWVTGDVLYSIFGLDAYVCDLAQSYASIRQFAVPFDVVYICCKAFVLYAFAWRRFHRTTWFGFELSAITTWSRWKTYSSMSVNAFGVLAEGIVWQIMSVMAARQGTASLAAHDLSL